MPSEVVDVSSLTPPSYFSEDVHLPNERQVGFWKSANVHDHHVGTRSYSNVQSGSYFVQSGQAQIVGAQHESSLFSSSLSDLFTRKLKLSSNDAPYGHSVDTVASHYEEEEPFESLKELEAQTIGNLLPDDDDLLSGVTDGLDYVVQPTGVDDIEDDYFSNVGGMDLGDDFLSHGRKNSEFLGVSDSELGMHNGSVGGEHPLGEHPSRTLFVRNINSNVEDSELRTLFERYGDICTLYTACKHRGFVMISYYDIRSARNAMTSLQDKPLRRRKLDIHYSIPKDNSSERDVNQGSLVVFNLDASISNDELRQIFNVYGEVKEIHDSRQQSQRKIIEFYDIRAAEAAHCALNRSEIAGKRIKLGANHPGGLRRSLEQEDSGSYLKQSSPPINSSGFSGTDLNGRIISSSMDNVSILGVHSTVRAPSLETMFHHGISSSVPSSLPSLMRVESIGNQSGFIESGHLSQQKFSIQGATTFHPHSLPEHHDGLSSSVHLNSLGTLGGNINFRPPERMDNRNLCGMSSKGHSIELNEVFGAATNGTCALPGHHYTWGNSYHPQPPSMVWPNSSYGNGISAAHPSPRFHAVPRAPSQFIQSVLPINNHHVGSAPSVNTSFWDRQHTYAGESSEVSGFHPGSLGSIKMSNSSPHSMDFASHVFPQVGGSCVDLSITERNVGLQPHHQRCMMFSGRGRILPLMSSFDSPHERVRSRRNEVNSNLADNKKQYELDIDRIMRGDDNRTTLMIKNIPNKYTSKMLLAAIDERHRGTYDFVYLPIDFKNKCNVGYAFINMTEPSLVVPFYQTFNGKKWEKFNSEKVASLAYARIQGKPALIAHFQNSSLMNEDKRCRPILFNTDGPNAGDQVPFPIGVNVRTRPGKARNSTLDESHNDISLISGNDDESCSGDFYLGSARGSDQPST